VLATVPAAHEGGFEKLMAECGIPWRWIGRTGGERLVIRTGGDVRVDVAVSHLEQAWRSGFERHVA